VVTINITDCNQLVTAHGCELRLYLMLSLYMIPLYSEFDLDIFHCNYILHVEQHQDKICTGLSWSWSFGSREPKVLLLALGHKIGSVALGSWLQYYQGP
jgi:hypothetical protein